MSKPHKSYNEPTEAEISLYAYQLWESEGRQHGRDLEYWLQAQAHLSAVRQFDAGVLPTERKAAHSAAAPQATAAIPAAPRGKTARKRPSGSAQSVYA